MLWLDWLKVIFLGIVEGITEFLPISSTAHLLIAGRWIGFDLDHFKLFAIVIQLGAILAVMVWYRERIGRLVIGFVTGRPADLKLGINLLLAFTPSVVIGLLLIRVINALLEGQFLVYGTTLLLGGLIMLWVERHPVFSKASQDTQDLALSEGFEQITWRQALAVGFAQCLAMIPGTSRSGATIIAGMISGMSRKTATEFSFFLAIPTMLGASTLSLIKHHQELLVSDHVWAVLLGFVMAFISAFIAIKWLLGFVSKHSYRPFAWYRVALGLALFAYCAWI